jgi:hypothetical protein
VSLKERSEVSESKTGAITAFLTAIVLIAVVGLGIMLGGALALRTEANLAQELIGFFMLFTFLTIGITEIMLVKNLSKLTGSKEGTQRLPPQSQHDLRLPQAKPLGEPVGSVTENTTRTLEHARR